MSDAPFHHQKHIIALFPAVARSSVSVPTLEGTSAPMASVFDPVIPTCSVVSHRLRVPAALGLAYPHKIPVVRFLKSSNLKPLGTNRLASPTHYK